MTRYMVDARTIWVLLILGGCSILLTISAAIFTVQAKRETHRARVVVLRADSLLTDWIKRGCIPK